MVSANDGKVVLNDGAIEYVKDGKDSVTIIDIAGAEPRIVAELAVPNSVIGPPSNVAIDRDGKIALVASARKYEGDPPRQVSDDRVTLIDLRPLGSSKRDAIKDPVTGEIPALPKISTTLTVGKGPSSVAIAKSGGLALVANRDEGSISVIKLASGAAAVVGKVSLGEDTSGPSGIALTPDGTTALVTLYGRATKPTGTQVAILKVHGDKVELTDRRITTGVGPFGIDISPDGAIAVVANLGGGVTGDADIVSVIDLRKDPIRVVNATSVAPSPEGIKVSPNGEYLAVSSVDGSHKPRGSAFYRDGGVLQIYQLRGTNLYKVTEAKAGHWCQGVAWSRDSRRIYLQCMVEKEIEVFLFSAEREGALKRTASIHIDGGPAGLAVPY